LNFKGGGLAAPSLSLKGDSMDLRKGKESQKRKKKGLKFAPRHKMIEQAPKEK
jgi:hypothetical protein